MKQDKVLWFKGNVLKFFGFLFGTNLVTEASIV